MPKAIEIEGLHKTFGKGDAAVHAVRGLDLAVEAGQVFGFLGPNGAGKSTTIRMVMNLIRPSAGRVRVHVDVDVHAVTVGSRSLEDFFLDVTGEAGEGAS